MKFSFDPDPETGYRDDYDDFLAQVHEEEEARMQELQAAHSPEDPDYREFAINMARAQAARTTTTTTKEAA